MNPVAISIMLKNLVDNNNIYNFTVNNLAFCIDTFRANEPHNCCTYRKSSYMHHIVVQQARILRKDDARNRSFA